MRLSDEQINKLNIFNKYYGIVKLLLDTVLKSSQKNSSKKSTVLPIIKKLSEKLYEKVQGKWYIKLIDSYLSVPKNIKKLSGYKFLGYCNYASLFFSNFWLLLNFLKFTPEKDSKYFKIIDMSINLLSYTIGLIYDIINVIYNPNPFIKIFSFFNIFFSTFSMIFHMYKLFNNKL